MFVPLALNNLHSTVDVHLTFDLETRVIMQALCLAFKILFRLTLVEPHNCLSSGEFLVIHIVIYITHIDVFLVPVNFFKEIKKLMIIMCGFELYF